MVFIWAMGCVLVLAWALGTVWGMLSALPELLPRRSRVIRKKSRLP